MLAMRLRDQYAEAEHRLGFRGDCKAFAQNLLGAGMAFAAAGAYVKIFAQLGHGCHAGIHGMPDFAIGNVIANTHNHSDTLRVSVVQKQNGKTKKQTDESETTA